MGVIKNLIVLLGCLIKYLPIMVTNTRYFGWLVFMTSCYYIAKVGVNLLTILPQPQLVGLKVYIPTLG